MTRIIKTPMQPEGELLLGDPPRRPECLDSGEAAIFCNPADEAAAKYLAGDRSPEVCLEVTGSLP